MTNTSRKLYRSARDKKLAGACGGIGAYLDMDPTLIRLGWIILTVLTGVVPGIVAYIVAAAIMPREP